MAGRTIAIGDVHGDLEGLERLLSRLPVLLPEDTLLFVGDYVDRGPHPAAVVRRVRALPSETAARLVFLRGNHEDAWLKACREGAPEFVLPRGNGCYSTYRSFTGGPVPDPGENPTADELRAMATGTFLPADVVAWMEGLPLFHEDEHAIYVHAGLPHDGRRWLHPSEVKDPRPLLWQRSRAFYEGYSGKRVVFGHTPVRKLPQEQSVHTPGDPLDVYVTASLVGVDTGAGMGGFLSAIELPGMRVLDAR
ncbi:MAG TPA: metallophosphoesterase family protein [Thermoanaerobaculia bacterium]|nr:metallophosphoesterase family protein [Thermoanaerobaculia bacterium]